MRRLTAALLLVAALAGAQERGPAQPDETRIVVPELILTVEELPLASLEATLPAEEELRLGDLSLPLPVPAELDVDQAAFFLSAPETAPVPVEGSSIYSTGLLGAGSASHVVGEISLFKLGEDPRFRLRFFYEGLDGFGFQPTGTGYFRTENEVEGSLEASSPDLDVDTRALFSERVSGLQGQSPFYSVGLRTVSGSATVAWRPDPLLELSAHLDSRFASRLQSASNVASVPRDREFAVAPGLGVGFTLGTALLSADLGYELVGVSGTLDYTLQRIDGAAGLELRPTRWLRISARAGVYSEFDGKLFYPWSVTGSVVVSENLETDMFGGFRQLPVNLLDRWMQWSLLAPGAGPSGASRYGTPGEWFAGTRVRWSPLPGVITTSEAEYLRQTDAIEPVGYDPTESIIETRQRLLQTVRVGTTVGYSPFQELSMQVDWELLVLDRLLTQPLSTVGGSVSLRSTDGRLALTADAVLELFPQPILPQIDITGSVTITDGVALDLVVNDLLAPLFVDGRPADGPSVTSNVPFIEPGFRASVLARISL